MELSELLQEYEKSTGLHKLPSVEEITIMTIDEKKALSAKLAWGLSRNISTTLKDNFVYQGKYSNMSGTTKSDLFQAILDLWKPSNKEIWYTSTTGEKVNPKSDAFNVNIEDNIYSDGKGIIKFTGNVTSIGEKAFQNRTSLTSIIMPDSVTNIGEYAFDTCDRISSIYISNSLTSIGDYAFNYCYQLQSLNIPNSVTSIGESAFACCQFLTSVNIGNSVESIGNNAFDNCESLESITIPDSVTSIGQAAFNKCEKLETAIIGNGLESISNLLFNECTELKSVYIGKNVTSIKNLIFYKCNKLESVYIYATNPPNLAYLAFENSSNFNIYVPKDSVSTYKAATNWSNYETRINPII